MPEDHMDTLYNAPNPLVRFVHRQRLDAISRMIPAGKNLRILDAGCGEGHLLQKLHERYPEHTYTGIDITDIALQKAKERCPFADIRSMDLTQLSWSDATFDVVIITEVLEHIFEYEDVLRECKRVLKNGGSFIITFPHESLWTVARFFLGRRPIKVPDHVNAFTPRRMRQLMDMPLVRQRQLPFSLPFMLALGSAQEFHKFTRGTSSALQ